MTTERDIRNQIRYAEKKGIEKGIEKEAFAIARRMLEMGIPNNVVQQATNLTEEQIKNL